MSAKQANKEVELLDCEICMQEIPATGGASEEAEDYVRHFCGLECYAQWAEQRSESEPETETD